MDYAKAQRTKYDPLIGALSSRPFAGAVHGKQSQKPRISQRRLRSGRDQALSPTLYRASSKSTSPSSPNNTTSSSNTSSNGSNGSNALSFKVWTRAEEEVLSKAVLEQCSGLRIDDLAQFVNLYDAQTGSEKVKVRRPDLRNLSRQYRQSAQITDIVADIGDIGADDGELMGDQMALSRIPPVVNLDRIDWDLVSSQTPYRTARACKNHFRWLVQPDHRTPIIRHKSSDQLLSNEKSTISGNIKKSNNEDGNRVRDGETRGYEHMSKWTRSDLSNLRLAMLRYASPLSTTNQRNTNGDLNMGNFNGNENGDYVDGKIVDWHRVSLIVGKSELQCQRKWLHFQQD